MLKIVLISAAFVGWVYSGNTACWSIDQICDEVFRLGDTNMDGALSETELLDELMADWNLSNGTNLSKHDFVQNWMAKFHDHHSTANEFFDKLDANNDGFLTTFDILPIILIYDRNFDGMIQDAEFRTFMHATHPDAIHGHGCH